MEGSTDQISLNSEAIYSGYQSVNYAKKSMSSLFSLLSANNVDYSLIANLGFDYQSIINDLNEQYNKLTDYSSRLLKVKNILLKADPNNEYLFQQIDLQFIGMDMGDNPSETDLIAYFNTMKNVYYTAKGKDVNELSDFEKAIIKNYEESGYADFDEYQELISEISQLKAEYSEAKKQVKMGAGLGGYSVSTDSEKYNENQNRLIELTKKLDELESRSSFLEKNLKEKGLIELSGWEELKVAGSKYIDTLKDFKNNIVNGEFEEAYDNIKTLKATNAVVLEKVTSGILKIGELIQDGTTMLKTTGASIITLGIDAVFGTNYTDDMWESTMDYVAIDQVGNIEKVFYENTSLGKELNDESILKYNSKGAESIKNASKKVGEIAAATAITVATGGAAAPLVAAGIGFLEGTGQGGEKYFSMTDENGNYTNRSVKDIGLSYLEGIQKGAEWYISGQVGSGFYNGVKSFVNPASITREVASRATGNTFKDAVVNTIKLPDMYVDFAAATAKAGTGYITNGKVNWKDYAFELGFAVLGNFAGELLSAAAANKTFVKNIDEQIARANIASKETGTVSQIKIHSIEDLTDKQLEAISDKQLVCFVVDSKKQPVSFEDAFIELKRRGKIPDDSKLMSEYKKEINGKIWYANYRATNHDNFSRVPIDSIDDLTVEQLGIVDAKNRNLVSFETADGNALTWEEAFIQLKREGKIPNDSKLMFEYKNEINGKIWYANYRATNHDNFSRVPIDSIDDLTVEQLGIVDAKNRNLVSFETADGNALTWEEAFIQLKREGKIPNDSPLMKEYQNEITRQIQYANYRAGSHDNFMSVRVDSLDDLTDGQLRMIGNRDLVSFQVTSKNGEIVSFEDAFIELKRRGKIPDDSPLMKEYKSKIATDIMQAQEAIGKNITPKVIKIDSINDLTLEQVLEMNFGEAMCFQVKEFDNKWFTYDQIYNSLKSKGSMLADVTRTAKGQTDVISKARSVYYELGKKVHYNVEAIDDNLIKDEMLSKMTTFDKLDSDNKIICRGWSELYKEALIESGVSVDDIRIINAGGQHWWVEAYDPKYNCFIVADATEATRTNGLMNFDLSSVKNGMPTKGFYVLSAEDYYSIKRKNGVFGTRIGNLAKDLKLVSNNDAYLRKLDISLGYASKQGYKAELVEKANKFFSDNLLLDKVFSSEPNAVKRNIFLKVPLDENVDGYESYGYFKKIFGDEAKLSWKYSKKYDTVISIRFPNDPTVMVYSKKLGRRIMSEAEYLELVSQI